VIIVACNGHGIVWVVEDFELIASAILDVAETEIWRNLDLSDPAGSSTKKGAKNSRISAGIAGRAGLPTSNEEPRSDRAACLTRS
jgi:hypothetical protein